MLSAVICLQDEICTYMLALLSWESRMTLPHIHHLCSHLLHTCDYTHPHMGSYVIRSASLWVRKPPLLKLPLDLAGPCGHWIKTCWQVIAETGCVCWPLPSPVGFWVMQSLIEATCAMHTVMNLLRYTGGRYSHTGSFFLIFFEGEKDKIKG